MAPQIVFMTGCSAGIGLAIVQRLARDPEHRFIIIATVIAMSEKDDLEAAVRDDIGSKVFIKELDITKDDNITAVVDDITKSHGRIDVLLNIAGLAIVGIPERMTRKQIDLTFNVNVTGTIRLTQAVLPHMKEKQSGKIITFSSMAGIMGVPYMEIYCASKYAVEGFFESLAAGMRAFNIRVCLIEPKQVNTGLWEVVQRDIKASIDGDESVNDIDRRQIRNMLHQWEISPGALTTNDIVEAVMAECIDKQEPVLRHPLGQVGGKMKDALKLTAGDVTGEAGLKQLSMRLIADPE